MIFNIYYNNINKNHDAVKLRITETPKTIRNNQYNYYTGKFVINYPNVSVININKQKISTTFLYGKNSFKNF